MVTKNEYHESKQREADPLKVEFARVVAFADNGEPLLQFFGEQTPSPKIYKRMKHYDNPEVGDRVMLIKNVVIGGWRPDA